MEHQIIVVGAGSAGMMCAIAAAEQGTRVLVIEKTSEIGGTLHLTAGHMSGAGTKRQLQKGILDTPEAHYADIMRINGNTGDATLIRLATELNPQVIDWLEGHGFTFEPRTPATIYGHVPYSTPRTHWGTVDYGGAEIKWAGTTIFRTIKPLWDNYVRQGLITVILQAKMTALHRDGQRISGLTYIQQRVEKTCTAQHIVLTTGGYGANSALFDVLTPRAARLVSTARVSSTGDGILAAMTVGAQFRNGDAHQITLGGIELEPQSGRTDFWSHWARISNSVDRRPRELYVNARGERFMNEDLQSPDAREKIIIQQPRWQVWVLFDEQALSDGDCIIPQWTAGEIRAEATRKRAIWAANNIEDLAAQTGLAPEALAASVAQYNHAVATQHDEAFGRTYLRHPLTQPPFYALLTYGFSLVTFGGLAVDAQLRVLDLEGKAIAGLFAAGEILGAGATSGHAFCGGMILTPALAFGRYLGTKLAASSNAT